MCVSRGGSDNLRHLWPQSYDKPGPGARPTGGTREVQQASQEVSTLTVAAALLVVLVGWSLSWSLLEADRALHPDVVEAYAWGKEFQLGYEKHGPFWAWIAGFWFLLFPATNSSFAVLEALNATLGLWGAWRLAGLFASGWSRHAAVLLLVATPFYTFQAYKYNANTIFLPLWPWMLFFFVRSVDKLNWRDAALSGAFAAALLLSKYYAVVLFSTCAISLAFHPNAKRYMRSALPWIAAAVFLAAIFPHVVWAAGAGNPAGSYALGKIGKGLQFSLLNAAQFTAVLALSHGGVLAILLLARRPRQQEAARSPARIEPGRRKFLAALVFAPPLLTIAFGLAFQLKIEPIMAAGIFPLMPLFLMNEMGLADCRRCFVFAGWAAAAITAATLAGAPVMRYVNANSKNGPSYAEPRQELAARVTGLWRAETKSRLAYVGGPAGLANAISFYSGDHPSSFVNLGFASAPWVTPAKLLREGLLIVCEHRDEACIGKAATYVSQTSKRTSVNLRRKVGTREFPEYEYDVFIQPPQTE